MPLQNHIHLSSTLGGTPEFAPNVTYKAEKRAERPTVYISVKRAIDGTLRYGTLQDTGGAPVVFLDFAYTLHVTEAELTVLKGELGRVVYFCDHLHANDGADHTADVRQMAFAEMGEPEPFNVALYKYRVAIKLVDADTV